MTYTHQKKIYTARYLKEVLILNLENLEKKHDVLGNVIRKRILSNKPVKKSGSEIQYILITCHATLIGV
jgi:hypothetical protein